MEVHGTHLPAHSQEIRCSDCGHRYAIAIGQRSGRCSVCGNITVVKAAASAEISRGARELIRGALLLPRGEVNVVAEEPAVPEPELPGVHSFRIPPDGARVQEIRGKYQGEWQLWSVVVKNFADPHYHAAYLTRAISASELQRAASRYDEHRAVMVLGESTIWQAEISDLMLERIQALSLMRMEMEQSGGIKLPYWLLTLPIGKGVFRVAWIGIGLTLAFKLLGLV